MGSQSSIAETYPTRITCFIDVLGFSRDVCFIEERPGVFLSVEAMLRHIVRCKRNIDAKRSEGTVRHEARMSCFSDCIVTSYAATPEGALRALWDAAFLSHVVLRPGYLPRGAITLAPLFHDDDIVYGRALVEAATLEKEEVKTPRILITEPVMALVRQGLADAATPELEQDFVRDDGDGPYVHVLGREWSFLEKERAAEQAGEIHGEGMREMFIELRDVLPLRYAHAPHEGARRKIEWMRDYVNRSLSEHGLGDELWVQLPDSPSAGGRE
jgi:hypothetical protein